jgi:23S rRNA pseudouridine2605 synthase
MEKGSVVVNGEVCSELGSKVTPGEDRVEVDGTPVELPETFTYLMLNKPTGVVTTLNDPEGRQTVADLLPEDAPRLWPVGRLDLDTTGALLMTNDGNLTHKLTHPSFEADKHYRVILSAELAGDATELEQMRQGVELGGGHVTAPVDIEVLERSGGETECRFTLIEGRNRQIRRMTQQVGFSVRLLERTGYGPVEMGDLSTGEYRSLEADEIAALYDEVGADPPDRAPV